MLQKCQSNSEAINEILDLFRFMVDKYAGMTLQMPTSDANNNSSSETVNDFLLGMLQQAWTFYITKIGGGGVDVDFEEIYGEESIVLHSIVRILNHIVVVSNLALDRDFRTLTNGFLFAKQQVTLSDLNEESGQNVVNTAFAIS